MTKQSFLLKSFALSALTVFSFSLASPAMALTMKECSAKYKAAQAAGTLGAMKWNDFRSKECGTDASAEPDVSLAADEDKEPAKPTRAAPKGVSFPGKVDAKYSDLTEGKARMKTCVDAYHANKTKGTLGELKWIQKGGGYYSLCNTRLKGEK